MCYSAQIWQEYQKYVRAFGATLDVQAFAHLFWSRIEDDKIKIPKAMEAAFADPKDSPDARIPAFITDYRTQTAYKLEHELFAQRTRQNGAERALQQKNTKTARESARIAAAKVERLKLRITDLHRTTLADRDARIFPGYFALVMVMESGQRVLRPMRYQCRPTGMPADSDKKFPGTYNARRDNLRGFWRGQFGHTHGVVVMNAFYEYVSRTGPDGPEKVILEFRPQPQQDLLAACLWSHWSGHGAPDLDSFAIITDDPPREIAAAGHDRCLIPIKPELIDAWLTPDPHNLAKFQAILDDRHRPHYEHRMAA